MRIISGTARGTKLYTLDGDNTRPTLDRVKEPLFSIIQNKIKDAIVLDLFAGSGALALESLSRGANKAILCEKSYEAIEIIKKNINKTHFEEKTKVLCMDYKKCLANINEKFDLVFIDPPYQYDIAINAVDIILEKNLLSEDGLIIIETDEETRELQELEKIKHKIEIIDLRTYGRVKLIFLKKEKRGWKMEIFTLLDELEEYLEGAKTVPFTNKCIVDKEEILDIIKEIRLKLPDELKQAKWVKEERGRILVEAQKEADGIVKEAENRIISMIDEHEITRKAYEQKAQIIETANEMSREISKGTKDYADNILEKVEGALQDALRTIENNRRELK